MKDFRKKIFDIIQSAEDKSLLSRLYDAFMVVIILLSILPLMCIEEHPWFRGVELFTVTIFIIDYLLRWMTADYKLGKGAASFALYPFTFMAVVDMPRSFHRSSARASACPLTNTRTPSGPTISTA